MQKESSCSMVNLVGCKVLPCVLRLAYQSDTPRRFATPLFLEGTRSTGPEIPSRKRGAREGGVCWEWCVIYPFFRQATATLNRPASFNQGTPLRTQNTRNDCPSGFRPSLRSPHPVTPSHRDLIRSVDGPFVSLVSCLVKPDGIDPALAACGFAFACSALLVVRSIS
jgi:hypothetical protein